MDKRDNCFTVQSCSGGSHYLAVGEFTILIKYLTLSLSREENRQTLIE